jgi:hypothetical protein
MQDPYERLKAIDQCLDEGIGDFFSNLGKKLGLTKTPVTDPQQKLKLTGDQGSAQTYVPDANSVARIRSNQQKSQQRLASLDRDDPGYGSKAATDARFQANVKRGADIADKVSTVAGLASGVGALGQLAKIAARKLILSRAAGVAAGRAGRSAAARGAAARGTTARGVAGRGAAGRGAAARGTTARGAAARGAVGTAVGTAGRGGLRGFIKGLLTHGALPATYMLSSMLNKGDGGLGQTDPNATAGGGTDPNATAGGGTDSPRAGMSLGGDVVSGISPRSRDLRARSART